MANETYFQQRNGSNGPFVLRKVTPGVGDVIRFDSNKKLVSGKGSGASSAASTDGALAIIDGSIYVTKTSAAALTLAAPTVAQDGTTLTVMSTTAFAHTVTTPATKLNGSLSIATFAAAVGNFITVRAYNGVWYVMATKNITLS